MREEEGGREGKRGEEGERDRDVNAVVSARAPLVYTRYTQFCIMSIGSGSITYAHHHMGTFS